MSPDPPTANESLVRKLKWGQKNGTPQGLRNFDRMRNVRGP